MDRIFKQKLRQARIRCAIDVFLQQLLWVALGAGWLALVAITVERLLAIELLVKWAVWAVVSLAGLLVLVLSWTRLPQRMQVSLLLDERLGLRERLSTALALESVDDPFVRCAREEALAKVRDIDPRQCIPIRISRSWTGTLLTWMAFAAVFFWLPQKDLLGLNERREQAQRQKNQMELAQKQLQEAIAPVVLLADQLNSPELKEDLAGLTSDLKGAEPQAAKRQVIRKLGDMSDKLNAMRSNLDNQSLNIMQQMLRQLRGTPNALNQQLQLVLARGQFDKAAALLRQMQQMMNNEMNDQQQALRQQLENLSQQLQELAKDKKALEEALEKQGLDRKLANLTPEQLKQALEDKGLTSEQIEDLMQKMAASNLAAARAASLGQALGAGGGFGAEDLAEAIAQLDELGDLQQQAFMSKAMLEELRRCIGCMGEGMCRGQGLTMLSEKEQKGIGTAPAGGYHVPEDEPVTYEKTRSKSKTETGPVVASWYFQGEQIKGQAVRDYQEVIREAGTAASEAINNDRIPKKYEKAVKTYFGQLEQQQTREE